MLMADYLILVGLMLGNQLLDPDLELVDLALQVHYLLLVELGRGLVSGSRIEGQPVLELVVDPEQLVDPPFQLLVFVLVVGEDLVVVLLALAVVPVSVYLLLVGHAVVLTVQSVHREGAEPHAGELLA